MSQQRKKDHIQVTLNKKVEYGKSGFDNYRFVHKALPEINFKEIDLSTIFLNKKLSAPILISSLTGGTDRAEKINKNLSKAAQEVGVAMAVGSQRVAIENSEVKGTFQVRDYAPDIVLLANLGAVQLNYSYGIKECKQAIEMIGADGLFLHLNPLQEAIQPEGDKDFSDLLSKIKTLNNKLEEPLLIKEVGTGISYPVTQELYEIGIRIIDVGGWGGTNWSLIEGLRRTENKLLGEIFADWGIPTADCISQCSQIDDLKIIGSGGIRTGIDMAKALALGADVVGIGLPFLSPAMKSSEAVKKKLENLVLQLKIAMFCVGAKNITELKQVDLKSSNNNS